MFPKNDSDLSGSDFASKDKIHEWVGNVWWNSSEFISDNINFFSSIPERPIEIGSGVSGVVYRVGSEALKISAQSPEGSRPQSGRDVSPGALRVECSGTLDNSWYPEHIFEYKFMELLINEKEYAAGKSAEMRRLIYKSIDYFIDSDYGIIPMEIEKGGRDAVGVISRLKLYDNFRKNKNLIDKEVGHILSVNWFYNLVADYIDILGVAGGGDIIHHNIGIRKDSGRFVFFDAD